MISTFTSPSFVNRVKESWQAGYGVTQTNSPGSGPFAQAGPTLDLLFTGLPAVDNTFVGSSLTLNFLTQQYQLPAQYSVWVADQGLTLKTFSQIITFTRASTGTYTDSAGVLQSAANNIPRLDYDPTTLAPLGFLVEEARTNSIRNNTMVGAAAGTPGTLPTNWETSVAGTGITREISLVGVENGISYVDVRYYGTPIAGTNVSLAFDGLNQIVAASGQTWTESVYLKLQAGSFNNTTTTLSLFGTNGTSGVELISSSAITSTPSNLRQCRLTLAGTFANAATTRAQPRVRIGYTVAVAFDITLRIGLPQLELGAFATSVIPTTTAAATRAADVASINTLSPWFNAAEGTFFGQVLTPKGVVLFGTGNTFDNTQYAAVGTGNNIFIRSGGAVSANFSAPVTTTGQTKVAFVYKENDFAAASNGGTVAIGPSGAVPVGQVRLKLGSSAWNTSGDNSINGYLQRITYYPRRLANAELQALTV